MGLWNKRWPQVFGTRLFTILNILQTLVYGKTKAGIRIAAAGIAFVYEKWSAGIAIAYKKWSAGTSPRLGF